MTCWPVGSKCKFSHDRNVERKVEKLNIYSDVRDTEKDKKTGQCIFPADWCVWLKCCDRLDGELGRGEITDGSYAKLLEATEYNGCEICMSG